MAISPKCDFCGKELYQPGALLFSPPRTVKHLTPVDKYHVCVRCFKNVKKLQNPEQFLARVNRNCLFILKGILQETIGEIRTKVSRERHTATTEYIRGLKAAISEIKKSWEEDTLKEKQEILKLTGLKQIGNLR